MLHQADFDEHDAQSDMCRCSIKQLQANFNEHDADSDMCRCSIKLLQAEFDEHEAGSGFMTLTVRHRFLVNRGWSHDNRTKFEHRGIDVRS